MGYLRKSKLSDLNYVYAENSSAIKWLKALGVTFIKLHESYGQQKKPFYEFLRIA